MLSIVENQQLKSEDSLIDYSSIVDFEQLKMNCSKSIVENRQLLNKKEKTNTKKQNKDKETFVNLQCIDNFLNPNKFKIALIDACNSYYTEFAPNR